MLEEKARVYSRKGRTQKMRRDLSQQTKILPFEFSVTPLGPDTLSVIVCTNSPCRLKIRIAS